MEMTTPFTSLERLLRHGHRSLTIEDRTQAETYRSLFQSHMELSHEEEQLLHNTLLSLLEAKQPLSSVSYYLGCIVRAEQVARALSIHENILTSHPTLFQESTLEAVLQGVLQQALQERTIPSSMKTFLQEDRGATEEELLLLLGLSYMVHLDQSYFPNEHSLLLGKYATFFSEQFRKISLTRLTSAGDAALEELFYLMEVARENPLLSLSLSIALHNSKQPVPALIQAVKSYYVLLQGIFPWIQEEIGKPSSTKGRNMSCPLFS